VWDTADGLPVLLQDGSTYYVTGPGGLPLEQVSGNTVYYYQQDQLGSTRILTDASGTPVASYNYDSSGNITSQTGTVSNPFLFAGQYRDAESGLYYLRARYYDPSTGQLISRDPKLSSTWAPYAYVGDNPINASDPSGMCGLFDIGGCIGDAIGAAESAIGGAWNAITGALNQNWTDFTTTVSAFVSSPAGNFLMGVVAGFTGLPLSSTSPDEEIFFDLGVGAGLYLAVLVVLTGPEDPLADAEGVRLATRAPEAGELALRADRAVQAADAVDVAERAPAIEDVVGAGRGTFADESILARGPERDFTPQERGAIDNIGRDTGCHTCGAVDPGTSSGHFIPDHQPPTALAEQGTPQRLFPQCLACSRDQGLAIARAIRLMAK